MLIMTKLNIGVPQHFASNKIRWFSVSTEDIIAFENHCFHKVSIRELKSSDDMYKSLVFFFKIDITSYHWRKTGVSGCRFFYQIRYIFSCSSNSN